MSKYCHIILLATLLLVCSFTSITATASDFDVLVTDRAVVQRCVTSSDARNIAVGIPGGFNFAFDPVRCRLDYVWFGGFLDYRGEATGRGGNKLQILGVKQSVGTGELPLRIGDAERKPDTIQFEGYRKEPATGIPTFLFRVDCVNVSGVQLTPDGNFPGSTRCGAKSQKNWGGVVDWPFEFPFRKGGKIGKSRAIRYVESLAVTIHDAERKSLWQNGLQYIRQTHAQDIKCSSSTDKLDEGNICVTIERWPK